MLAERRRWTWAGLLMATAIQPLVAQVPRIGVVGGIVSSSVTTRPSNLLSGKKALIGVDLGLSSMIPVTQDIEFAPELAYVQKGVMNDEVTSSVTIRSGYIELPLLVRWKLPGAGPIRTFVTAGPSVGFKVRCKVDKVVAQLSTITDCADDPANDLESTDAGLALGIGGTDGRITVALRYALGLTRTNKASADELTIKNRTLSAVVLLRWRK
jgi:hypothetical protein